MPSKFSVGDLVKVHCLPQSSDSIIWKKSEEGPHLGIIVDIVKSPTQLFDECLAVKIGDGDVITISPNMVQSVGD